MQCREIGPNCGANVIWIDGNLNEDIKGSNGSLIDRYCQEEVKNVNDVSEMVLLCSIDIHT